MNMVEPTQQSITRQDFDSIDQMLGDLMYSLPNGKYKGQLTGKIIRIRSQIVALKVKACGSEHVDLEKTLMEAARSK